MVGGRIPKFLLNRYLFFDKELEKRTLIALGGKSPFKVHINTIMDYTFSGSSAFMIIM